MVKKRVSGKEVCHWNASFSLPLIKLLNAFISYILEHLCFNQVIFLSLPWKHFELFSISMVWLFLCLLFGLPFRFLYSWSTLLITQDQTLHPQGSLPWLLQPVVSSFSIQHWLSGQNPWRLCPKLFSNEYWRCGLPMQNSSYRDLRQPTITCRRVLDKNNTHFFSFHCQVPQ